MDWHKYQDKRDGTFPDVGAKKIEFYVGWRGRLFSRLWGTKWRRRKEVDYIEEETGGGELEFLFGDNIHVLEQSNKNGFRGLPSLLDIAHVSRGLLCIALVLKPSNFKISSLSRNSKAPRECLSLWNYSSLVTRTSMLMKCEFIACLCIILIWPIVVMQFQGNLI
jgi:hypothetical protein